MKLCTIDFETEAIELRPHYPPTPVGVSIKYPGKKAKYLAWGHPTENNCTKQDAERELRAAFKEYRILCHNGKFDFDVAETHLGIPMPPTQQIEDTLLLGFLNDPHSRQLGLKPLAQKYLNRDPLERDALREWVITNVPEARKSKTQWGAYISKAPGKLVGKYANADSDMTHDIFEILAPKIKEQGMTEAYEREKKLIPILLENERKGIRVDLPLLEQQVPLYEKALEKLDVWLKKYLKAPEDVNLNSDQQFADVLENAGLVTDWVLTKPNKEGKGGGQRSVSKGALSEMIDDQLLLAALEYRGSLSTFNGTFLTAWRDIARETNGWIHTTWNSTAQPEGGGTRTGRLSSSKPTNFTNIPSSEKFLGLVARLEKSGLFKKLKFLPKLPECRRYVIADTPKDTVCGFDWAQQEPRTLGHFEDGKLCRAYQETPEMDVYIFAMEEMLKAVGRQVTRGHMKVIILAILYGLGSGELASRLGCSVAEAKAFKEAFLSIFPDIKNLNKDLRNLAKSNSPMRTWGGRIYYCESPRIIKGVLRSFEYKMINYLVQGSCADMIKESVIRYHSLKRDSRLLLMVHDEMTINAPKTKLKKEMGYLKEAMTGLELDVPLLVDGYVGNNWADMEEVK